MKNETDRVQMRAARMAGSFEFTMVFRVELGFAGWIR